MKKNLKYLGFLFLALFMVTACDDTHVGDDEELNYNTNIDVVQFRNANVTAPVVADGDVKPFDLKVLANGPSVPTLNGDITVNFTVDPASTAVEGVHYTLNSNSMTLTKANDYLGTIPVSILTDGLTPPLNVNLILNITTISTGNSNVVVSGNKSSVNLKISYSCFADLTGTYTMTNSVCASSQTVAISANDDGSWYLETADGGLLQFCSTNDIQNDGSIFVICGEVEAVDGGPGYCLGGGYGIGCITGGTWDPTGGANGNGLLTMQHTDAFFSWSGGNYTSTYVRQ